jgi:hypothetical protein
VPVAKRQLEASAAVQAVKRGPADRPEVQAAR